MVKKILIVLLFATILPSILFAGTVHFGGDYSLRRGEVVQDDLYVAGNNTTIAGNVVGDLLVAGLNVFVGGDNTVSEDALVIGATVNVLSDIQKDLRILSGKGYFGGKTGEDLAVVAQEIQTLPQSVVGKNLLVSAGRVVLGGEVRGNVQIAGGEVILNDKIGGNVSITANRVVIGPAAVISGTFSYSSSEEAEISLGAQILGEIAYKPIDTRSRAEKFLPTLWGTWVLIRFVVLLLGALVLHGILRNISVKFVSTSIHEPGKSFLQGFLFLVAVPIAIALIFLTFIGIPFGLLGVALYTMSLVFAYIYTPIFLGSLAYKITHQEKGIVVNWKTILWGVGITVLLSYIPYAGPIIKYAATLLVLGGIYQVLFEKFVEVR